jgi:signal peptidase II
MNRIFKLLVLIFFMIIVDQLTKGYFQSNYQLGQSTAIIDGFFNFTYVHNRGAAFGFGATYGDWFRISVFKVFPVLIVIGFLVAIWNDRNDKTKTLSSWAYALIVSGAIGNLIDRIGLDYVVDFLDFHLMGKHYPAFNVADSCITIGVMIHLLDMILEWKQEKQAKEGQVETDTAEASGD